MTLAETLVNIEHVIAELGAPVAGWTEPGLRLDEIAGRFDLVGLSPTDEIVTWFAWHNGVRGDVPVFAATFAPPFIWHSLDSMVDYYQLLRSSAEEHAN